MESLQDLLAEQQVDPLVVSSLMLLGWCRKSHVGIFTMPRWI